MKKTIDGIIDDLTYVWHDLNDIQKERLLEAWQDRSGSAFADEIQGLGTYFNDINELLEQLSSIIINYSD